MTFQELLDRSEMRMTEMSARFGIPYRTLQDWKAGVRKAPQYVIDMMAELLDHDKEATHMITQPADERQSRQERKGNDFFYGVRGCEREHG